MKLIDEDIKTREVLGWRGINLFHMQLSSCSQKTRICLNLKGIEWTSRPVDLLTNENLSEYFLGINPRGLVPVLVDDGEVHIESNDILLHLEQRFPEPALVPGRTSKEVADLLRFEDDLHLDVRALSFRFLFTPPEPPKTEADLAHYANTGSGTVDGQRDTHIDREIAFWKSYIEHSRISDTAAKAAAHKFFHALSELDERLERQPFLMGERFSLLDIAWIVYCERLRLAGYPLKRLHPNLAAWHEKQSQHPKIAPEIALPQELADGMLSRQRDAAQRGDTLEQICFA